MMNQPTHPSMRPPTLAEFCEIAEVEEEARAVLRAEHGPREFIAALVEGEHYADAVRLLAHVLPRREAIWWAWSCARRAAGSAAPAPPAPPAAAAVAAALDVIERWIREPGEENRRAAMVAAEAADIGTPAGCAALAIYLSGGSIAPPGLEAVEPEPYAASKAIAGSVVLAAVSVEPERAPDRFQAFITLGLEVADRVQLWPVAEPDPGSGGTG